MKIALAQINPTVAAFKENAQRIASAIEEAKKRGADLVVFPEMALMGSPAKDLLEHPGVIQDNLEALERLADEVTGVAALIGFVDTRSPKGAKPLYNAVAFVKDRKVFSVHHKFLLSTYDVFDEARYFESDPAVSIIEFMGRKLGLTLGEELLKDAGPTRSLVAQGARMIINIAAFPYSFEEHKTRLKTLTQRASLYNTELVYVNMVGGNDELIYEGGSCVIDNWGRVVARARDFEEDLVVVDLKAPLQAVPAAEADPIESVYKAL
ncbi:MAG: nitrilase-related carbon-nitrogen hydrolase, partial [Candidatus Brocadiales bacterium]